MFAAVRAGVTSADVLRVAEHWEAWVLRKSPALQSASAAGTGTRAGVRGLEANHAEDPEHGEDAEDSTE
jgi:hypothetical protein